MNSYVVDCLSKYRREGIFIDTNAALLYIIGSVDLALITKNKITCMYNASDFELFSRFVESFKVRYTTPNVLTELSNLLKPNIYSGLASFIVNAMEIRESSVNLVRSKVFGSLGLADASILDLVLNKHKILVVTDDGPLATACRSDGIDVLTMREILDK